jgi:hypothetical protein
MFKFSNPVKPEEIQEAYEKGMPKLEEMQDRAVYEGSCRNARKAMWVNEIGRFVYVREKFGSKFLEDIQHPAKDNGFDLFIPNGNITEFSPEEKEIVDKGLTPYIDWLKKYI